VQLASLPALLQRTWHSFVRHAGRYALCAAGFVVITGAIGLRWTAPAISFLTAEVAGGIFLAIVTCTAFGDAAGLTRAQVWDRALERSWAIIVLGFVVDLLSLVAFSGLEASDLTLTLLGIAVMLMAATLVFATVAASVSDDDWWWLVPSALSHSMLAAWRSGIFPRALILLGISEFGEYALALALQSGLSSLHIPSPALWAGGLANALLIPPVQTLATFIYLDAIEYRPPRPCSE
jgi:hypothetical protein